MDMYWVCERCGTMIPEGMGHGCARLDILEELSALNLEVLRPQTERQSAAAQHAFNQKIIEVLVNAGIVAKNEGWNAR